MVNSQICRYGTAAAAAATTVSGTRKSHRPTEFAGARIRSDWIWLAPVGLAMELSAWL